MYKNVFSHFTYNSISHTKESSETSEYDNTLSESTERTVKLYYFVYID